MRMALQLYTLREECEKDFASTLEKVAVLGFKGVEFAGFFDFEAARLKECLDRLGLEAAGAHVPYDDVTGKAREVMEYNGTIGNRNIVVPWYDLKSPADADALAAGLLAVADEYEKNGFRLLYHNHDSEMKSFGGKRLLDLLAEKTAGKLRLELDLYWVHVGGISPAEYMKRHAGILELVHLKDGKGRDTAALGEGEVDFAPIFETFAALGLDWAILENDLPKPNGLDDVARSRDFLKSRFSSYVSF